MKTKQITGKDIGCWIDCSCNSADRLNERIIRGASDYGFAIDDDARKLLARIDYDVQREDDSELLSWIADEAVDFLNSLELPSYCAFTVDDNCLFLSPCVDNAREDVGFVSSRSEEYPESDYCGEWLHVNDHGNATLYCRDEAGNDVEIWSAV